LSRYLDFILKEIIRRFETGEVTNRFVWFLFVLSPLFGCNVEHVLWGWGARINEARTKDVILVRTSVVTKSCVVINEVGETWNGEIFVEI
jgi:hypothetical protein